MSNLMGMDTGEVRLLASRIRAQAEALQGVVGKIDAVAHQIAQAWQGPDATEFIGWWQQQHRMALLRAHQSLAGLAQSADNNAAQQDQASGVTGNGGAAQVMATGGAVGAASAAGAVAAATGDVPSVSGDSASRQAVVNRFVDAYPVGSSVGPPHTKGQCVGLFEEYSMNYVHTPEIVLGPYGGGACDLYTHFNDIAGLKDYYTQLPANAIPQPGDVAVWDSSAPYSKGYGHVAIVTGTAGSMVQVIQQNYVPDKVSGGSFPVGQPHLLGYLRPKTLN